MAKNYISLISCPVANFNISNKAIAGKVRALLPQTRTRFLKITFLLSFIFSLFLIQEINAQANTYVFAQSNGTYIPITGGTVVVTSVNNVPSIDTYASGLLAIPSFTFAGTSYTTMSVTSNGQLALGNSTPSSSIYTVLSSTTGGNVFLAPFSADLNSSTTTTSDIRYETIGNEIIVQWTNFQRIGLTENFSFQVRMNTVTGVIKFVYDGIPPYNSANTYQPQVGIKSAVGDYSALTVVSTGSWNSPVKITTGITAGSICRFTSTTGPTSGLTYTWSPAVPGIPNCATSFVPANSATGVAISPTLSWANGGGAPTSYDVYFGTSATPLLVATQSGTTYSTGTLAANTTYYWQIVPKNSFGSAAGCTINSFTTGALTYCIPTGATAYYITNFKTTGGVTDINNSSGNSNIYGNYSSLSASQFAGSSLNLSISTNSSTHYFSGWVDWNNDGDFVDAGEAIFSTSTFTNSYSGVFTIAASQPAGSYRMRIANSWSATSITSCSANEYSEYEDYTITVLALAPCAGTPTAGAVTVNPVSGQPGSSYAVSASGFTVASGLTFQWQYSDNGGGTWTNQGASTPSYSNLTGMIAPAFGIVRTWRLLVTCISSGLSANSSTATFTSAYCIPSSTAATTYINNFSTTGGATNISNLGSGYTPGGYQDNFSSQAVTALPLGTFNYNIVVVGGTLGAAIWIDWNNNGIFEPTERVFATTSYGSGPFAGTITVPGGAASGNYRMRVMVDFNNSSPSNPCMTANARTETEDYKVTVGVLAPCAGTPSAGSVTVNPVSGQPGSSYVVSASGFTGASGLTFQWQYSDNGGGTWTNQGASTPSYSNLTGMIAPAFGIVRTWRLVVTCAALGLSANSSTGTFTSSYCIPTNTYSTSYYITNVTSSGGIVNFNNSSIGFSAYTDFTSIFVSQYPGSSFSLTATHPTITYVYKVWIDWNNDGDFDDPGENVITTGYLYSPASLGTITVPPSQPAGNYRMRIRNAWLNDPAPACGPHNYGEAEDYTVKVLPFLPCTTPTAQPTGLSLTVSGALVNGSFTAAVPAPNGYLVVAGTNATPPTLSNGTTYSIGSTIGAGYIVVDNDSNTTFSANSLNSLTTYYFFIYSMNNLCLGGPYYLHTLPLTGTATTGSCLPVVSIGYQNIAYTTRVQFLSTLNDVSNSSGFSNSPLGYQDFTGLSAKSVQAQGEYINVSVQNNVTTHIIAWVDWNKDGNFAAEEKVYDTKGIGTSAATFNVLIPLTQAAGDYKIRIRSNGYYVGNTYPYTACQVLTNEEGETEDYLFTVVDKCTTLITSVNDGVGCSVNNNVVLGATASAGVTQFKWYSAMTGGTLLGTTAAVGNSGTFTTPSITVTTNYYVTASNGGCEPQTRTLVVARISKSPIINITQSAPKICGETEIVQITAASTDKDIRYLIKESFEAGALGTFTGAIQINNTAEINAKSAWQNRASTYITEGDVWLPATYSGPGANKFAMATSDVGATVTIENALISPVVNTVGFANLTLKFDLYYSRYYIDNTSTDLDFVQIYGSIDGGASWITSPQLKITEDVGNPGMFASKTFDMSVFTGSPNVRLKIAYHAVWCDGVAIDNIELFGPGPITGFKFDTTTADAFTNAAATIPYVSGTNATSIFIKPSLTQLENAVISIPVTTNSNFCGPSVNIINNTKIFPAGTPMSDWNAATNWRPTGVPAATNCVIIMDEDVQVTAAAVGLNLSIKENAVLTVNSGKSITITDKVNIEAAAELRLKNGSSLIQTNDVLNTGAGLMKMERTANIRKFDYIYWSSPVTTTSAFSSASISPGTNSSLIYKWIPTISTNINGFGNWASGIENMIAGKGYIVRGPDLFSNSPAPFTATFAGTPSNGTITIPIHRGGWNGGNYSTGVSVTSGTNEDDNWNLVGNPYPSAIKAVDFLISNTNIDGFINVWTHGSMPNSSVPNPFYNTFSYNYDLSDYITFNASGSQTGPGGFNGFIPAGQGFFVAMLHASPTPGNLTFTNSLRSSTYSNSVFYKGAAEQNSVEEGRIWLDIIADDGRNVRTLVAYVEGATNDRDRLYDAITDNKENLNLFSNIGGEVMKIQGRQAPLEQADMVSMGIKVPRNGIYTIAIGAVDGLFENAAQNIYLEDKNTAIIHNLRESPYAFSAQSGEDAERFVLRYSNQTLGTANFGMDSATVFIASSDEIKVKSTLSEIKSVRVFDVLGRQLAYYSNVNSYDLTLSNFRKLNSTLVIQVTLENDLVVNKKIIY